MADRSLDRFQRVPTASKEQQPPNLVEGNKMRCPNCGALEAMSAYKALDRNPAYDMQLTTVYVHRQEKGGCGHAFAPSEQHIIAAYLSGDLVPTSVVNDLRDLIDELRESLAISKSKENAVNVHVG